MKGCQVFKWEAIALLLNCLVPENTCIYPPSHEVDMDK